MDLAKRAKAIQAILTALSHIVPSGGGNPNTTETVTGTLASMFGDVDLDELETALSTLNATAYLEIDASALGAGTFHAYLQAYTETHRFSVSLASLFVGDLNSSGAIGVDWKVEDGTCAAAFMLANGNIVDISSYASAITTTMTIIWHPLP